METSVNRPKLIALFTDFGCEGPYLGQMTAVLLSSGVSVPVVNLLADAPLFDPRASAYLLAAVAGGMPAGTLFLSVVDPGVGGERSALLVTTPTAWFIGPDNGLLSQVARRAATARVLRIDWRPQQLSDSFHGRDLFAPVAAALCSGSSLPLSPLPVSAMVGRQWADELWRVIYVDGYGNAYTGIRGTSLQHHQVLEAGGVRLQYARTFCSVHRATPFWYVNSQGLVEIAVSEGRADRALGLKPGSRVACA